MGPLPSFRVSVNTRDPANDVRRVTALDEEEREELPAELFRIPRWHLERLAAANRRLTNADRRKKRWRIFLDDGTFIRLKPHQLEKLIQQRR